ncbi:hypothetical protein ABFA07_021580 [Porites harrisoni]
MQDDAYEEFECDEDPTWSPEEIEDAYKKLKEDDESVKTHQNPRLDLQGKNIPRGTEGNCFPFQTSSFVSVLPLVLLFKTQTFCITDRYLVNRRKFLQKLLPDKSLEESTRPARKVSSR